MRILVAGEMLKERRTELGLTQESVCDGLCSPVTMSRIENGTQNPSKSTLTALLQRLGLPGESFYALVSDREAEMDRLQTEITSCNVREDPQAGLEKLERLDELNNDRDPIVKQFVLRARAILGRKEGDAIVPYTPQEELELLGQAIRLTVPKFDGKNLSRRLYSTNEIKLLNQMAIAYYNAGEKETALEFYRQLLALCEGDFEESRKKDGLLTLIAGNYARLLCMERKFEEALGVAHKGLKVCREYGQYRMLSHLLGFIAESYCFLGNTEESRKLYYQAYYTFLAIGDEKNAKIIQKDVEKFLRIDFP